MVTVHYHAMERDEGRWFHMHSTSKSTTAGHFSRTMDLSALAPTNKHGGRYKHARSAPAHGSRKNCSWRPFCIRSTASASRELRSCNHCPNKDSCQHDYTIFKSGSYSQGFVGKSFFSRTRLSVYYLWANLFSTELHVLFRNQRITW
jgi:hypothetical protein